MNGQGKLLIQYLKNADNLIIPVYQRNYDWNETHCRKLYDDLCKTILEHKKHHFFGGIVSVSDPMGSSPDYLIIDGQQRITTVTLFLLAMANLIKTGKVKPKNESLYDIITKKYLVDEINPRNRKMKLKPIKGDQDAYEKLWGDPGEYVRSSNITQNYLFFCNAILRQELTVDDLLTAVEKLQIIDITLAPPDDDPQLVFESLNSTGLELNEGDKIRNYVLMGLDADQQEYLYDAYWNPIEKKAGFDSKNNSYDVSAFIRDYLSIKQRSIPAIKDVYTIFKGYEGQQRNGTESLLKDMLAYAKRYSKLIEGRLSFPAKLQASIYRLNRFESSVTRPFLLEVLRLSEESLLTPDDLTEIFRTVEYYLFRRTICDLPFNTLSKVFLTLCNDIKRLDGTYENFLEKMRYILANKKEKAAFPTDEEFVDGLKHKNIYAMPSRYKAYLFERFENGDSAEYKAIYAHLDQGEYTIEHIMPQKLTPTWIAELGEDAETIYEEWLHRLGNLTLTAYNSKYSNASFSEKKTMKDGYLDSGLKMNQYIASKEHWGPTELEERGDKLANQALSLWPYADSAYTPPEKQYDEFALDDDISFTNRSLVKYQFRGAEHSANNWVEMYIAVLKELHNRNKTILNYLADAGDGVDLASQVTRMNDQSGKLEKIDENLYIWTNTSTQYKVTLLQKFFTLYQEDPSNLIFYTTDTSSTGLEGTEKYQLRRQYWIQALPIIREAAGTFSDSSPTKNNSIAVTTKKSGVYLSCVANLDETRVELYLDCGEKAKNKVFFDQLINHKAEIEAAYGGPLTWQRMDDKNASRICDSLKGVGVAQKEN